MCAALMMRKPVIGESFDIQSKQINGKKIMESSDDDNEKIIKRERIESISNARYRLIDERVSGDRSVDRRRRLAHLSVVHTGSCPRLCKLARALECYVKMLMDRRRPQSIGVGRSRTTTRGLRRRKNKAKYTSVDNRGRMTNHRSRLRGQL